MSTNTILTISRQYGAGGREIAQLLAQKRGIHLYDRQIVHLAGAELKIDNMDEAHLRKLEVEVAPLSLKFMPFYIFGNGPRSLNDDMYQAETEVIQRLAQDGSCVILGRCADHILKNDPAAFSVFICADEAFRSQRGATVYGGKSLAELKEEDNKRAEYYHHYTGKIWGDPQNYDLVVNTSQLSTSGAADAIIAYLDAIQR